MHRRRWVIVVAVLSLGGLSAPMASAQAPAAAPTASSNATGWYLALGDSLAAGYQPGQGDDKTGGYVGGVLGAVKAETAKTKLVNVACSGETVVTMVNGGRCAYDEGTQLAQALEFLHAHSRTTRLVTIDIGANDVQRCVSRSPLGIDFACIQQGLGDVQRLLPQVLARLHAAAPEAQHHRGELLQPLPRGIPHGCGRPGAGAAVGGTPGRAEHDHRRLGRIGRG